MDYIIVYIQNNTEWKFHRVLVSALEWHLPLNSDLATSVYELYDFDKLLSYKTFIHVIDKEHVSRTSGDSSLLRLKVQVSCPAYRHF